MSSRGRISFGAARRLALVAGALAGAHLGLRALGPALSADAPPGFASTLAAVALLSVAGAVYCLLFKLIAGAGPDHRAMTTVLAGGLLFRLLHFGATPVLEDDWRRYLWDGAVIAHGVDPYAYAPARAAPRDFTGAVKPPTDDPALVRLRALALKHHDAFAKINYPYVATVYPPLAEAAFAAAAKLRPFSLDAWRLVMLAADVAAFWLLTRALAAAGRAPLWAALYWWCPLTIFATYNMGHMDVLLAPFLAAATLSTQKNRPVGAAAALAGAVAVKLWPLILAPVFFSAWRGRWRTLALAVLVLGVMTLTLLAPMLAHVSAPEAGLAAYANRWRRFSAVFPVLAAVFGAVSDDGDLLARLFVAGVVAALSFALGYFNRIRNIAPARAALAVALALYVLSPTGYPWYALWFVVFTPFAPSVLVGVLTATLPLYLMRFYLLDAGRPWLADTLLPTLAFGVPGAIFLTRHALDARRLLHA